MVRVQLLTWVASPMKQRRDAPAGSRAPVGQHDSSTSSKADTSPATFPAWRMSDLRQGLHALAKVVTFGRITT